MIKRITMKLHPKGKDETVKKNMFLIKQKDKFIRSQG